jgi:thiol:disulfide interchange protein DsbC
MGPAKHLYTGGLLAPQRSEPSAANLLIPPDSLESSAMNPLSKLTAFGLAASLAVGALLAGVSFSAQASEANIRKLLAERVPGFPKPDEVRPAPMPGLWEVRYNDTEILYTDGELNYVIQGSLIDGKTRRNLTEERVAKLSAIDPAKLPAKDGFTIVRGNGKRKLVVFEDPNCGYCKRFERDLQSVDNVTITMFLYPILGPQSTELSKNLWCAKDRVKAWNDWMVKDVPPAPADAKCDTTALERNVAMGRKFKITGTPTLVFADGNRVPGAIKAEQVEKFLSEPK